MTKGWDGRGAHDHAPPQVSDQDANKPKLPYRSSRKKRRPKGKLNDGEWAPGYGPAAKKK